MYIVSHLLSLLLVWNIDYAGPVGIEINDETGRADVMQDARIEGVFFGKGVAGYEVFHFLRKTHDAVLRHLVQVARLGIKLADFHEVHVIVLAAEKRDEK